MAIEIERRFLVNQDQLPPLGNSFLSITQGYLGITSNQYVTRVRLVKYGSGSTAFLTLKKKISQGVAREYEFVIPPADASCLLLDCLDCGGSLISKKRYLFNNWEIDFFSGNLEGIVIAEIELSDISQEVILPSWIGREITEVKALSNFQMSQDSELAKAVFSELIAGSEKIPEHCCSVCGEYEGVTFVGGSSPWKCQSLDCVAF